MFNKSLRKKLGITVLAAGLAFALAAPAVHAANAAQEAPTDTQEAAAQDAAAETPSVAVPEAAPQDAAADASNAAAPDKTADASNAAASNTAVPTVGADASNAAAETPDTAAPEPAGDAAVSGLEITMKTYKKTFKTKSGQVYKKISYEYPVAAGNSIAAAAFNKFYDSQREKWLKAVKADLKEAKATIEYLAAENGGSTDRCYTDDVTCEITSADENYICVFQSGYDYMLGAHGMPYRVTYILDAKTGKKVTAANLLGMTKQQLNDKVRKLYLQKFDKTKGTDEFVFGESRSAVKKTLAKIDFNKNRYYLKNGKIRFYLDPYAVAPYAAGFIEAAVKMPEKNTLLADASPDTSALALYVYDGKSTTRGFIFDSATEKKILDAVSRVNAKKASGWTPAKVAFPVYGLEIAGTDGREIQAAWSNGYWIAQDGTAYSFDYDFKSLADSYDWTSKDVWQSSCVLPCARPLSQSGSKWNVKMLSPAEKLSAPEAITAQLTGQTKDSLTVKFANNGSGEWSYGEYFSIQVLLDGVWYAVPTLPGSWAFNDIACILPSGEAQEKTYSLAMYGSLPAGTYRLAAEGMAVEFEI